MCVCTHCIHVVLLVLHVIHSVAVHAMLFYMLNLAYYDLIYAMHSLSPCRNKKIYLNRLNQMRMAAVCKERKIRAHVLKLTINR